MNIDRLLHYIRSLVCRPGIRWSVLALSVYTLTTLIMMYPVPFSMNSVIAGQEYHDAYTHLWQLWWVKQAVLDPHKGLAHLTLLNYPAGTEHPFMLTMIAAGLTALPFSLLLSPAATYNSQVLLSFILSGMTMYWLIAELVGDHKAGLVGGFIFAFFPSKTGHVLAGHLMQVTVYWFPLYALFLWRLIRKPRWNTALMAVLVLVPTCLIHVEHLAYLVLPLTVSVLLVNLVEMKGAFFTRQRLGWLALVFVLAALLTAPFLLPTVLLSVQNDSYLVETGTVIYSADLLAFFTPSPKNPALRALGLLPSFAKQVFSEASVWRGGQVYPGVLVMGLALWGLLYQKRKAWIWGVFALVAAVLSLGPLLKVGNQLVRYEVDGYQSYVALPYALVKQIPILQVGRTPSLFNEMTMFAMAILSSYGTAALASRLARRARLLTLLLAVLLIGIGFEYVIMWPFPTGTAEIPPTIQSIAAAPGSGGLLHLPMTHWAVNSQALYYQTFARRPIVGGFIHRLPPDVPPWSETLLGLAQADQTTSDIVSRPNLAERVAWLHYFNLDYVIFHKFKPEADANIRDFIQALLGDPKLEDNILAAFPVPRDVPAPKDPRLYTLSQEGWHLPELNEKNVWQRRMYADGQLYLYSAHEQIGCLRFTVNSQSEIPLEVYSGQRLLDSFIVNGHTTYITHLFTLTQGMNSFRFHAPGKRDDVFVFDHVSFVPQDDLSTGEGLDVNFGDQMRLRGWTLDTAEMRPGGVLTVTLTWEATVGLSDRHIVFAHLLGPDGKLVAQHDAPPLGQLRSLSAWPSGYTFSYRVLIELPNDLPAGDYRLRLGVYLWPNLDRLPVLAEAPGAENGAIELTSVQIAP